MPQRVVHVDSGNGLFRTKKSHTLLGMGLELIHVSKRCLVLQTRNTVVMNDAIHTIYIQMDC